MCSLQTAIECPELMNLLNGIVSVHNDRFCLEATYECDDGFELDGTETRQCQLNGEWANDAPVCKPVDGRIQVCRFCNSLK